jgi:hypothetical protein
MLGLSVLDGPKVSFPLVDAMEVARRREEPPSEETIRRVGRPLGRIKSVRRESLLKLFEIGTQAL